MSLHDRVRQLFSHKTLDDVTAPTTVTVLGRVAAPNTVRSPVTGREAAWIEWTVFERRHSTSGERDMEIFHRAHGGVLGSALLVEVQPGQRIALPAGTFEVRFDAASDHGEPLERELPPELGPLPPTKYVLHYRELFLRAGDPVRVTATVQRAPSGAGDAYREGATAEFTVVPTGEPALVEDWTRAT